MLIKPSLKSIFILFLFFWIYGNLLAQTRPQRINISGFVTDSQTGERLIGTNISLVGTKFGTTTNNFGYYNISTAATPNTDSIVVQFSYLGYEKTIKKNKFINRCPFRCCPFGQSKYPFANRNQGIEA